MPRSIDAMGSLRLGMWYHVVFIIIFFRFVSWSEQDRASHLLPLYKLFITVLMGAQHVWLRNCHNKYLDICLYTKMHLNFVFPLLYRLSLGFSYT